MDFRSRNRLLGVEEKDKNNKENISSVPRNIDYQIAGILAGGILGLLIAHLFSVENASFLVVIFAIVGFFLYKPLMRFLS